MTTLDKLIETIPEAPPGHERFRIDRYGLEFLGCFDGWVCITFRLQSVLCQETDPYRITEKLRWLEDCANAAIAGWRAWELNCYDNYNGGCNPACSNYNEGQCDATWADARDRAFAAADWIAAVKDAARGEE